MLQLRVEAIKWETADTATFFFTDVLNKKITYIAGQFITLVFTHHHEEIRRSYSLSSSPDEDQLSVTIKRITNGEISRFMLTKIKVGNILNAVEPAGKFIVNYFQEPKDIFLFAGGSGIVPVFSQLKYILARPGDSKLTLLYSSQDANAILFKDELDALAGACPDRLSIVYLISSEANRLNNIKAERLVRQHARLALSKAEFYLCGPFVYMRMIRLTLLYMGLEPDQIRKENFVIETVGVPDVATTYPSQRIQINIKNELHDIVVDDNQTILQAALQNDIPIPYSCRAGICSACAARCKSGKVEMAVNDVLTDFDLSQNWILTCTGHPVGDNVIIEIL